MLFQASWMSDLGPLMSLRMNWTFPKWMTQTTAGGKKKNASLGFIYLGQAQQIALHF